MVQLLVLVYVLFHLTNGGKAVSFRAKLMGTHLKNVGKVEVEYNGTWGPICHHRWELPDANVICKMLNYTKAEREIVYIYQKISPKAVLDMVDCKGSESSIEYCSKVVWPTHRNCDMYSYAGVVCKVDEDPPQVLVRLIGGPSPNHGLVEVRNYGVWGNICYDYFYEVWSDKDANVVCRTLGYPGFKTYDRQAADGVPCARSANIVSWGDGLGCNGTETTVSSCNQAKAGRACLHTQDVCLHCNLASAPNISVTNGLSSTVCTVELVISHIKNEEENRLIKSYEIEIKNLRNSRTLVLDIGLVSNFTIGDGNSYNGTHNVPLIPGTNYSISIKAVTKSQDGSNYGESRTKTIVTAKTCPKVYVNCKSMKIGENKGNATIEIKRSGRILSYETNLYCKTIDGTATQSADYIYKNISITFKPNVSLVSFDVQVINDKLVEFNEVLKINCTSSDENVEFLPSCMTDAFTVEIKNDDFDIGCKSILVYESQAKAVMLFNRTGLSSHQTTIFCTTRDKTAKHSNDYIYKNATVKFDPNQTVASFDVQVINDRIVENDEVLHINCSSTDNSLNFLPSCAAQHLTIEIKDDDVDVGCQSSTINEQDLEAVIQFNRSGANYRTSSITCTTVDGTASQPTDYIPKSAPITFGPEVSSMNFSITVIDDKEVEETEDFGIKCTTQDPNVNFLPSCTDITVNIKDNDVAIDCKSISIKEKDENGTILFRRSGALSQANTIHCTTVDLTAKHPSDYIHKNVSIRFEPNQILAQFTVQVINDKIDESNEELYVNCTTYDSNVNFLPSCTVKNLKVEIKNDAYDIYLKCVNTTIEVTERTKKIPITVKKEGPLQLNTTFWVQTLDGTALAKNDYLPMNKKTYTFTTGQEYLTFMVEIVDDEHDEKEKMFNITIGAVVSQSNYPTVRVAEYCATVWIKDDDPNTGRGQLDSIKAQFEEMKQERDVQIIILAVAVSLAFASFLVLVALYCIVI